MKTFKNRPAFDLEFKLKLTETFYINNDVLFLQEASAVEWKKIQGFNYKKHHDSVIIYRTEIFGDEDEKETKKWT